jgi:four helix bundle protein
LGFRGLEVYKRAHRLALEIHEESLKFPDFETYELGSQVRRSTKSVCLNIAEGYGRKRYQKDYSKFLISALSSVDETRACLDFAFDLGYFSEQKYSYYLSEFEILGKQLNAFVSRFVPAASSKKLAASTGD